MGVFKGNFPPPCPARAPHMGLARTAMGIALIAIVIAVVKMCAAEADSQVSRAAANYRAISKAEATEAPTPSLELVEASRPHGWQREDELVAQNWVDCTELASSSARTACLKKLGLGLPS